MDPGSPSWDPEAKTFSFFLHKRNRESVLCIVAMDALENAAQSSDLSEPTLTRIFGAHRQLIELRAAQKLNAGQVEANGSVLVRAEDIKYYNGNAIDLRRHRTVTLDFTHAWSQLKPVPSHGGWPVSQARRRRHAMNITYELRRALQVNSCATTASDRRATCPARSSERG